MGKTLAKEHNTENAYEHWCPDVLRFVSYTTREYWTLHVTQIQTQEIILNIQKFHTFP
jgi:hypothetical protein